jgi:hypothetical protein
MRGHDDAMIRANDLPDDDGGLLCRSRFRPNAGGENTREERQEDHSRRLRIPELDVRHEGDLTAGR